MPLFAESFIPKMKSRSTATRSTQVYIGSQTIAAYFKSNIAKIPMIQATQQEQLQFAPTFDLREFFFSDVCHFVKKHFCNFFIFHTIITSFFIDL